MEQSPYFGRWTLMEEAQLSSKGKLYKTIDVAPCSKDFCGVSVTDDGSCGPTLFRFFGFRTSQSELAGHGKWGDEKKKLVIMNLNSGETGGYIKLGIGDDDIDFTGREGSMPTFEANYTVTGAARCTTK